MMHIFNRLPAPRLGLLLRASSAGASRGPLLDSFGRRHDYLRVSLTERCNLRCRYCMPEEGVELTSSKLCLTLEEIKRLTSLLVDSCGITKIRLTGGEPTIERKLLPVLQHLQDLRRQGLQTVAMTTNGLTLKSRAALYKDAGLDLVNISLDTLQPARFELVTRRKGLRLVLEGLHEAVAVGFRQVKLNCVVVRGFNDDELAEFARLAVNLPVEVRFIEFMPFMGNKWAPDALVGFEEMLARVRVGLPNLARAKDLEPGETSRLFRAAEMLGAVGFISSMTNNFCSGCNRLRLTSDGNLKVCLLGRRETSLRDMIRNGASDRELVQAIQLALSAKKAQHAGRRTFATHARGPHSPDSSGADSDGQFSHLDGTGRAKMVNVGAKRQVRRLAIARGEIRVGTGVLGRLLEGSAAEKGDILTVAKVAGLMAAKATSKLIPMCHSIPLDHVQIDIQPRAGDGTLVVEAKVEAEHKTGVEMECLVAVSVSLLTIYDMCKSASRNMLITNVSLVRKDKATAAAD